MKNNDVVPWVLNAILSKYVCSQNPHVRQAACIWLLSLVKKLSQHKEITVGWSTVPCYAHPSKNESWQFHLFSGVVFILWFQKLVLWSVKFTQWLFLFENMRTKWLIFREISDFQPKSCMKKIVNDSTIIVAAKIAIWICSVQIWNWFVRLCLLFLHPQCHLKEIQVAFIAILSDPDGK